LEHYTDVIFPYHAWQDGTEGEHYQSWSSGGCTYGGNHAGCESDDWASIQARLLGVDGFSESDILTLLTANSGLVTYNSERGAIQVFGCRGGVIAHVPASALTKELIAFAMKENPSPSVFAMNVSDLF
jgi:hypothetical protein